MGWYRGKRDTAGLQRLTLFRLPGLRPYVNNPLKPAPAVSENTHNRTEGVGKLLLLLNNTPPPLPGVNGSKGTAIRSKGFSRVNR